MMTKHNFILHGSCFSEKYIYYVESNEIAFYYSSFDSTYAYCIIYILLAKTTAHTVQNEVALSYH